MKKTLISLSILLASIAASAQFPGVTPPPPSPPTNRLPPGTGMNWGNPWNSPLWNNQGGMINPPGAGPDWQNRGVIPVVGCGYDMQGVWRTIPMKVRYVYNGVQYDVTVLNVWNPWTDMWDRGVDDPAYNTSYTLRGQNFSFYTVTSTGTYYFNL